MTHLEREGEQKKNKTKVSKCNYDTPSASSSSSSSSPSQQTLCTYFNHLLVVIIFYIMYCSQVIRLEYNKNNINISKSLLNSCLSTVIIIYQVPFLLLYPEDVKECIRLHHKFKSSSSVLALIIHLKPSSAVAMIYNTRYLYLCIDLLEVSGH